MIKNLERPTYSGVEDTPEYIETILNFKETINNLKNEINEAKWPPTNKF
jgi:hypothetical protein